MPIAKVQLPDGRIGRFEVPEGTTQEQVIQYASQGLPKTPEEHSSSYEDLLKRGAAAVAGGLVKGGPLGAISAGVNEGLNNLNSLAYKAGGAVTDATGSPAAGALTAALPAAIPVGAGGEAGKAMLSPAMQGAGRWVMQQAVKPSMSALLSGDAAKAIDTMLANGINATKGGVMRMQAMADQLAEQVKGIIANSQMTLNKSDIGTGLLETLNKFRKQVNPQADMDAVKKAWLEFRNHPDLVGKQEIPVQLAQELKQGTYQQLSKKYGEMGSADTEAQKALARLLKEGIAQAEPGVAAPNELQSALRNAIEVSERRALMGGNNTMGGMAWVAHNPVAAAGLLADKSALLKSLLARGLYSGSGVVPSLGGQGFGALYGMNQGTIYQK